MIIATLTNLYAIGLWLIQHCVANVAQPGVIPAFASLAFVVVGFSVLLAWQTGLIQFVLQKSSKAQWVTALYVHASNGFYLESICGDFRSLASLAALDTDSSSSVTPVSRRCIQVTDIAPVACSRTLKLQVQGPSKCQLSLNPLDQRSCQLAACIPRRFQILCGMWCQNSN